MKRRRSRRWRLLLVPGLLEPLLAAHAWAQQDASAEGAIQLLRPIGARAVGVGQAVVARHDGSEAIWWNPSGLALMTSREVAIHHSQDFFATGDAISIVVPSSLLGVVAVSADIEDFGEQENTTGPGGQSQGTILPRSFVFSAAYATPIGARVRSGVVFKIVQLRLDCTGPCDVASSVAQTYALDAGVQYDIAAGDRLTLGASVRNLGLPLQVVDSPQADPLPSRVQIGFMYRPPMPEQYARDVDVTLSADLLSGLHGQQATPRMGAEFGWQKRGFARAGYVFRRGGTETGGPSLGLGLVSKNIIVDISRVFTGFSADAGQAPTYLSLRVEF